MDQSKLAVLGTVGLVATAAICCAIVFSGRFSFAGSSTGKPFASSPGTTADTQGVAASNKIIDDEDDRDKLAGGVSTEKGTGEGDSGDGYVSRAAPGSGGASVPPPAAAARGVAVGQGKAEEGEALIVRFNRANSKAKKLFTGQRYALAAEQYGIALELCDELPNHENKRTALLNNRGAAYEKDGQYALALADCSMCLSREVGHKFARVRKSRVLEAMGKYEEALSEVCAHLLLERDRVQAKAALNPSEPLTPPAPPANLEGLLQKVASKRADAILLEREQAAEREKEAAAAGGTGAGTEKLKPLVKQVVMELLRSFGSFAQLERRYKGMQETAITRELEDVEKAGKEGDGSVSATSTSASRVSSLLDRGLLRMVKRNYDGSREDIFEAAELLSTLTEADTSEAGAEEVPSDVKASVWEWQGTFLQLSGKLDEAMEAYRRCGEGMEEEGEEYPADVLIKMAWVCMDKEDMDAAKDLFARAGEAHPEYGSSFAHRARLDAEKEGAEEVRSFLRKAIELNSEDAFAWEQLCRIYVQAGDIPKATATIEEGLKSVPKSDALLTLKAELKYSMAMKAGDASSCGAILELFDAAIRANPSSPVLYLNKASCLLQMMSDVGGAMELLEKGVSVDPTSVNALVQLANLKIMVAREMAEAEAATALLDKAVALCTTKEELMETLSVRVATEGRIKGALLLGRTTLG
ncbi:unnamed protein product [Ectocarpus sp. CCAP 1310/34]|nr:unnamed protein product [Ectocarpus sp. CCAP 1310/34]